MMAEGRNGVDRERGRDGDVLATGGGYREGRIVDGQVEVWLCPHVHRTRREAECCPSKTAART